jgi:hypothetical protein
MKGTQEMNSMLSQEAKSQGIRYVLASMSDMTTQPTKKNKKVE